MDTVLNDNGKKQYYLIMLLLVIEFLNSFLRYCNVFDTSYSIAFRRVIFLIISFLFLYDTLIAKQFKISIDKRFSLGIVFTIYCLVEYFARENTIDITDILNIITIPMVCCLGYHCGFKDNNKRINILITAYLILMTFLYFNFVMYGAYRSQPAAINSVFFVVLFLPIVLLFENRFLKLVSVAVIIILTFITMKSTVIVMVALVFLCYYFLDTKNHSIRLLIFPIAAAILLLVSYFVLNKYMGINLYSYLIIDNLQDGGNGRFDIWRNVIQKFSDSNLLQKLFGNGFEAVSKQSINAYKYSAHNDFLEILYDFGIVGLIPFIIVVFNCLKEFVYMVRTKYRYAATYGSLIAEIMTLFLFSNAYFQSSYLLIVAFFTFAILRNFDEESINLYRSIFNENNDDSCR